MIATIQRRKGVDDDIARIALFLLDQSEPVAIRFVDSVQVTLKELARLPRIGSLKQFQSPVLAGVRTWWVRGFRNHLIYYLPLDNGIDVLAVAHGAQDIESLLQQRI